MAINAQDNALRTESFCQVGNQAGVLQRGGINGNLVGTFSQDIFGIGDGANSTGDAKRDVEQRCYVTDPVPVDSAAIRACGDVVEHEFVGARAAISFCQLEDVANDAMIAKLYALDNFAVTNVKAGNYAAGRNVVNSVESILPSNNARPLMAAGKPIRSSAFRSLISRTPPEACNCICGYFPISCA